MEEIDWPALAGFARCNLVIAPILLRELENKKIVSLSAVLRGRAARTIDFLPGKLSLDDPIELRPGVRLVFCD